MSPSARPWRARRYRAPDVTPLEVWNLPVLGHELWELLSTPRVEADRREGVPEAQLAHRLMPGLVSAVESLVHRHAADAVWLTGGLLCLRDFRPALEEAARGLRCPVHLAESPRYAPVLAGLHVLPASVTQPLVLDVGQTSVKCVSQHAPPRVFERDVTALPRLFIGMPRPSDGHHIPSAVRFIASALQSFARDTSAFAPDGLCLALPCPVDEALRPGGCTYGWEGHTSLVQDILEQAHLPGGGDVLVLNDAELSAEAARREPRLAHHTRILCLTLGFGPGGALLERG